MCENSLNSLQESILSVIIYIGMKIISPLFFLKENRKEANFTPVTQICTDNMGEGKKKCFFSSFLLCSFFFFFSKCKQTKVNPISAPISKRKDSCTQSCSTPDEETSKQLIFKVLSSLRWKLPSGVQIYNSCIFFLLFLFCKDVM